MDDEQFEIILALLNKMQESFEALLLKIEELMKENNQLRKQAEGK